MRADPDAPALDTTLTFMQLLWSLDHALQKRSKWMAGRQGVTGPQRLALRLVGRRPGLSAGDLAAVLKLDPSTLTGVLGRLTSRGFLTRRADPSDRRRARLTLTARGHAVAAASAGTIEAVARRVLRATPTRDRRAAERLLRALVDAFEHAAPGAI